MTSFTALIAGICGGPDTYEATIHDNWLQGRTTYGGLSGALCFEAAQRSLDNPPPLRSGQFLFVGPVSGTAQIRPKLVRRGKSTAFMTVDLESDGQLAVRASLVFAAPRDSRHHYIARPMPDVAPPDNAEAFFPDRQGPNFASQFDVRRAGGAALVSGAVTPDFLVWARHIDPEAGGSLTALIALADVLPPPALALPETFKPISTMTWAVDLPSRAALPSADEWLLLRSTAETVEDGYSTQSMALWNAAGEPLMIGRQNVAVFI